MPKREVYRLETEERLFDVVSDSLGASYHATCHAPPHRHRSLWIRLKAAWRELTRA